MFAVAIVTLVAISVIIAMLTSPASDDRVRVCTCVRLPNPVATMLMMWVTPKKRGWVLVVIPVMLVLLVVVVVVVVVRSSCATRFSLPS